MENDAPHVTAGQHQAGAGVVIEHAVALEGLAEKVVRRRFALLRLANRPPVFRIVAAATGLGPFAEEARDLLIEHAPRVRVCFPVSAFQKVTDVGRCIDDAGLVRRIRHRPIPAFLESLEVRIAEQR